MSFRSIMVINCLLSCWRAFVPYWCLVLTTLILIFFCRLLTSGYGYFHFLCLSSQFDHSLPCPNLWLCCCFYIFFVRLFADTCPCLFCFFALGVCILGVPWVYFSYSLLCFLGPCFCVCTWLWLYRNCSDKAKTKYIHRSKDPENVTVNSEKQTQGTPRVQTPSAKKQNRQGEVSANKRTEKI